MAKTALENRLAKRISRIEPALKARIEGLPDNELLAVHDLTHAEMERRYGSASRTVAGRATLAEADNNG